ncbi:MAG: nuclear transport factor 2 family protein [Bacteroidota bacterium]
MRQIFALIFLALFIVTSCKTSFRKKEKQLNMESETKNLTIAAVDRFNAAFNKHDVDAVMNAMTEDCIFENTSPQPDGTRIVGAEAVRAYWIKFFTNNPDALFETEEIFAEGDRCVVRWIYRKTREGKPWHLRGVDIFKIRNGKVAEKLAYVKG